MAEPTVNLDELFEGFPDPHTGEILYRQRSPEAIEEYRYQKKRNSMEWRYTDPRLDINKRDDIVILRPSPSGHGFWDAGVGQVDTKNGWYIGTTFEDHPHIDADMEWDPTWCWTFAPQPKT